MTASKAAAQVFSLLLACLSLARCGNLDDRSLQELSGGSAGAPPGTSGGQSQSGAQGGGAQGGGAQGGGAQGGRSGAGANEAGADVGGTNAGGAGGAGGTGTGGQAECPQGQRSCDSGTCVPEDGCCAESDCLDGCQTCSAGACVAVSNADDPDSCAGTCDAKGTCKSTQGQTCQTGDGCISGTTCAPDGVCCDTACTNSCEACDVEGFEGTCTPVAVGAPHGNRPACEGDDENCAGSCTGRADGECTFPTTRACGSGAVCSGTDFVDQGTCSSGFCVRPTAEICAGGYVCSASVCKTACASDSDCNSDYFCAGGTCHSDAKQVATGDNHTCALLVDNSVRCWGLNGQGAIGLPNSTPSSPSPITVSGLPAGLTAIAVGSSHTCALVGGGSIRCWGANASGQLGNGSESSSANPVTVSGIAAATQLSAGGAHTCARLADGTVWCWGANGSGALGVPTATQSATTPVRAGSLTSMIHVATGGNHTCAVKSDGTAWCWGGGSSTATQVAFVNTASALTGNRAPNYRHTCALLSGGSIRCWGSNSNGQLGNGSTVPSDESVAVTGIGTGATSVTTGGIFSCASISDGTARCWGSNGGGQLGNGGTAMDYLEPVTVTGLSTVTQVAAGGLHACALLKNGSIRCWGWNLDGQLGTGNSTNSSTPIPTLGW